MGVFLPAVITRATHPLSAQSIPPLECIYQIKDTQRTQCTRRGTWQDVGEANGRTTGLKPLKNRRTYFKIFPAAIITFHSEKMYIYRLSIPLGLAGLSSDWHLILLCWYFLKLILNMALYKKIVIVALQSRLDSSFCFVLILFLPKGKRASFSGDNHHVLSWGLGITIIDGAPQSGWLCVSTSSRHSGLWRFLALQSREILIETVAQSDQGFQNNLRALGQSMRLLLLHKYFAWFLKGNVKCEPSLQTHAAKVKAK